MRPFWRVFAGAVIGALVTPTLIVVSVLDQDLGMLDMAVEMRQAGSVFFTVFGAVVGGFWGCLFGSER